MEWDGRLLPGRAPVSSDPKYRQCHHNLSRGTCYCTDGNFGKKYTSMYPKLTEAQVRMHAWSTMGFNQLGPRVLSDQARDPVHV